MLESFFLWGEMITSDQIRAGRALARLSAKELAEQAGVGLTAIQRIENGVVSIGNAKAETVEGIQRALEAAGIVFLPDGYGVTKRQP
jgi:transcriptional regulator with XRE-family HTH domain